MDNNIQSIKTRLDTLSQKTFQLSRDLSDAQLVALKCYGLESESSSEKMLIGWLNNKHLEHAVKLGLAYYNDNEKDMDELKENDALNVRLVFVLSQLGNKQARELVAQGYNELKELAEFFDTTNITEKGCENPEIDRMKSRVSFLTNKLLKSVRDLANSQLILGDCHYRNFDDALAIQMYTDSANYGNTDSMLKLSNIYSSHPNEDKEKEIEYIHRAAQLGNKEAQQQLVKFYKGGKRRFWQRELEKSEKDKRTHIEL